MPGLHRLSAPAKLNLFLHVTGRRPDGYHLLQSVFVLIDWADTFDIDVRDDGQLIRRDLGPALPDDDLCLRAARLLQTESGTPLGAEIRIDKQVPWGAGMGGGSSDAATVLLALNRLWGLDWPRDRLAALAIRLGADVPFFIHGRNAWVEGVGETIQPIDLPAELLATPLVVLKPPVAVPTQAIFTSPLLRRDTPSTTLDRFLAAPQRFGRNDLQAPAEHHSGQIGQALAILESRFDNSRMTGSGSAVFSWVNDSAPSFDSKLASLVDGDPAWTARLCHILPCHPLLDVLP